MDEMKHDYFYKGLNSKYQWMLAHKVDGEHPAGYSNLILVDWWWEQFSCLQQCIYHQWSDPKICQGLFFGCQSFEQPSHRHAGYKWFWRIILLILGLCYKGSGGRGQGYDKEPVALVVPDSTAFRSQVPVTLDTPTINWIINVIKDNEIDELLASLNGLRMSCLLACCPAELSVRSEAASNQTMDLTYLNEAVKMTKKEEIDAFLSHIIHSQTKTMCLGDNMHVMTQTLKGVDGPCLPHGLSIMNAYTKWWRSVHTWRRYWKQVLFTPVRAQHVMQL